MSGSAGAPILRSRHRGPGLVACVSAACLAPVARAGIAPWADERARGRVVLQLEWIHRFQFAGYCAAEAKGFCREAGLDQEPRAPATGAC